MRTAILALISTLVLAGCGSLEQQASKDAGVEVAWVGDQAVTKGDVDALLDEAAISFDALGRPFPKEGTPYYLDLRDQALLHLVEESVKEPEAERLGTAVDPADVERDLKRVDQEAFEEESERAGLTMDRVRANVESWRLRLALFSVVVAQKEPGETNWEVMRGLEERLQAKIAAADYAPGWRPATSLRSPVPPELQNPKEPTAECDLKDGPFTLQEVAAHGCLRQFGVPVPGVDAKPCPEIPIHDFGISPLADNAVYSAYESRLMNTAPSCVGYPETEDWFAP